MPRAGYEPDWNNFAPRLGFALTLKEGTVLRTGYGVYAIYRFALGGVILVLIATRGGW